VTLAPFGKEGEVGVSVDDWFVLEVLPLEAALERYLRRNWRSVDEIADLRQEVYARVYRAAQTRLPEHTRALVFATARNLIVDYVRRERVVSIETVMDIDALPVFTEAETDSAFTSRSELRALQSELDKMPARTRDIVILRKIYGYSQSETADQLGVSEPTVERHVGRGMRQLADALGRVLNPGRKTTTSRSRKGQGS
jgi:RNA polymerase sigma-70 factor (ECF subfamily)